VTGEREGILDGRFRALTVGAVLAVSVVAFEALALTTVAPTIARDLGGVGLYAWIFSAFLLSQMVGAVAAGQQADRRGFTRPFLAALALLAAGLLVGALSPNMVFLIFGRALQGLGGGALVACVYAIINAGYPDNLRPRMMAMFSSAFILPALVGPAIAGFVAEQITWRAIFYGFLPFLAVVGFLTVPAFGSLTAPAKREDADGLQQPGRLPSALLLAAGTGLSLAGLKMAAGESLSLLGLKTHPALVGLPLAAVGLVAAVIALRNVLPEGALVARQGLSATVAAKGLMAAAYFYTEAYLVLTLNDVSGYSATTAGLVISAGALSWTVGTWIQERLDKYREGRRRRSRALAGSTLLAIGISGLAAVVVTGGGNLHMSVALVGWIIASLGIGLANPANATIAFAHTPSGKEGSVSSSVLIAELFGPATTIGIGGAIVALGASYGGGVGFGISLAFGLSPLLAALTLAAAYRLPKDSARTTGS